jgi:First Longin domain of FUZ, MON1 and HPS1/Second Longin domain of FUZ, MON1 and HPS1
MSLPGVVDDDVDDGSPWTTTNFLVMSNAGKPIYFRYGPEDEMCRICGLLEAVRSSVPTTCGGETMRSLQTRDKSLVFLSVGSLFLVAIGDNKDDSCCEALLRLQLEHLLGHILFTVTERVQEQFAFDPSFDLRTLLGTPDMAIINGTLDDMSPAKGNPGPYFLGGIPTLFPISPTIRYRASKVLRTVGLKTDFTAFSILAVGDKLVSLVQPSQHLLGEFNLHLLLRVVSKQPTLQLNELWIPVCLPLFSSTDFLFCYTHCLDPVSKLCLILVSQQSTTQQFQLFRTAATSIRESLGLPPPVESSVLEILETTNGASNRTHNNDITTSLSQQPSSGRKDIQWKRTESVETNDLDYVDVSLGDGDSLLLPYLPSPPPRDEESLFLQEIRVASQCETQQSNLDQYLGIGSVYHFIFRMDIPIAAAVRNGHPGKLVQCISAPLGFPFVDESARRNVWTTYQKLRLRQCFGSTTVNATLDAFDRVIQQQGESSFGGGGGGVRRHCPAIALANSSTRNTGISYVIHGSEMFIAMHGQGFEL